MRQRAGAPRWRAAESREAGFPPKQPAPDMLRAREGGIPGSQMSVLGARGERRMRTREEERGGDFASPALSKSIITMLYSMSRIIFEKNNGPLGGHYLKRHRGRVERYLRQLRPLP